MNRTNVKILNIYIIFYIVKLLIDRVLQVWKFDRIRTGICFQGKPIN